MYAIDQDLKKINDVIVDTFGRLIVDHDTVLEAEAGTTGYKGTPCRKAGGRTYMRIECHEGDFYFETVTDKNGRPVGVELACCGDAGLNAVMKALDFCRDALNDQRCDVDD